MTTTIVNTLQNTATATAVTINLAGQQLVAGNGAIDAGTGLIAINAGATSLTVGASANDGTVTAGSSGAFTLGLINAGGNASVLDIKSAIVDNAGGGSVSIITLNTGKVILEGTNIYTGTTKIGSGSTLQVGNGGTTGMLGSGNVEVDGSLVFNCSGVTFVFGSLTGSGSLTQSGTGTVVLGRNNTAYSGAIAVNSGGTLQVGAGGTSGDLGASTVTDNASLTFNRTDTVTVGNVISGTGMITQAGTGTTSLTGSSAMTTSVQAGTLQFAGSANYTGTATISGGTLQLAGASTLGGGAYSTAITDNGTLRYSSTANQTISGVISGSGGLTKDTTAGTLTLTGANTYAGQTVVNAGTLALNFSASGAPTANILSSASTLSLGNATFVITGASAATNTQAFAGTTVTGTAITGTGSNLTLVSTGLLDVNLGALTAGAGTEVNFNGATGATAGARFLTSTGSAGALLGNGFLYDGTDWASKDATNTYVVAYTGYTNVATNGGVIANTPAANVRITEGGAGTDTLGAATTTVNSLLMGAGTTAATVSMAGRTLVVNGGANATGAIAVASGAKSLTLGASANDGFLTAGTSGASGLLLISNNAASTLAVNSAITNNAGGGAVSVGVTGPGTTTLAGANTYTGGLTVNAGTLVAATPNLATGAAGNGNITVNSGGTISVTTDNGLWGNAAGTTTKSLTINAVAAPSAPFRARIS